MKFKNYWLHFKTILKHKWYVFLACKDCGIMWRGIKHDLSKFSLTEFFEYANNYTVGKSPVDVAQKNMGGFMKSVLIKRLESSFEAFKKTLNRFITSYIKFIDMCERGTVFISKKYDVYDLLDECDDEKLMELVDSGEILKIEMNMFNKVFTPSLQKDLWLLKELLAEWEEIIDDPKKTQFLKELKNNPNLRDKKMIVFTESKETAEYVHDYLKEEFDSKVIMYSGQGSNSTRDIIEANYNPSYNKEKKNDNR